MWGVTCYVTFKKNVANWRRYEIIKNLQKKNKIRKL